MAEQPAMEAEVDGCTYFGVIKSYNERRGFGFVACEETARRYGRDAYLSKEEAAVLAKDPIVGFAAADGADGNQPPIKEGDFLQFQAKRSREGHPQAVNARRLRRLRGTVAAPLGPGCSEGAIVIKGDGATSGDAAAAPPDEGLKRFLGARVRVKQADCGQLHLAVDDEVAFCLASAGDGAASDGQALDAQLVELLSTPRTGSALLGCFSLELPRTAEPLDNPKDGEPRAPSPTPSEAEYVVLDGHALADYVVLSGLPRDLQAPELMRLFSKCGASKAVVTHPEDGSADSADGFASVTFAGPVDIARMLGRAAHTINEQGSTTLARLGPCRRQPGEPALVSLPALSTPTLSVVDTGALMVRWAQIGFAAGYLVELRPVGGPAGDDYPWVSVDAAAGFLEKDSATGGLLPEGLLGSRCGACRVNNLRTDLPYEARVTYYVSCGCRSQASACTPPVFVAPPDSSGGAAPPEAPPAPPASPPVRQEEQPLLSTGVGAFQPATAPPPVSPVVHHPPAGQGATSPPAAAPLVSLPPPLPPLVGAPAGAAPPPQQMASWRCRCPAGSLVPAPCAPELLVLDEACSSLLVMWPTVVHAAAYQVELFEERQSAAERFQRAVPEGIAEALVELRIGNLQPGNYSAAVCCVAPCGCESARSPWSSISTRRQVMPPAAPLLGAGEASFGPPQQGAAMLLSTSPMSNVPPSPPRAEPTLPAAWAPPEAPSAPPFGTAPAGAPSAPPVSAPPAPPPAPSAAPASSPPPSAGGAEALILD